MATHELRLCKEMAHRYQISLWETQWWLSDTEMLLGVKERLLRRKEWLLHEIPALREKQGLLENQVLHEMLLLKVKQLEEQQLKEKQMLLSDCGRSLCDWRSLSKDVIPQIESKISWMARQGLNPLHIGVGKIRSLIAQVLQAKYMGIKHVFVGQRATSDSDAKYVIAAAALCADSGLQCTVYMDAQDIEEQGIAGTLQTWGAKVNVINLGTPKLEDAKSAAISDWLKNLQTTYCIGLFELEYEDLELQPVNFPLDYDDEQNSKLNLGNFEMKSVVETILHTMSKPKSEIHSKSEDENVQKQLVEISKQYCGRESPHKSPIGDWPRRYLSKEFPILTGSHTIVNAVVQTLLAKQLGKKRIVVAAGNGQRGLTIADDICARVGLQCIMDMDAQDTEEQRNYILKMQPLHAEVRTVHLGTDSNAMGNGVMNGSLPDDEDEPEHARTDCVRCRYCGSNVSRQHQEYHNNHQCVGAKFVLRTAAFTLIFATLTRNVEGLTDHVSKLCTWLSSFFEESDRLFAKLGSLSGWVDATGLPQICAKWKNNMEILTSVSEDVSKGMHVLRGVADKAARLANKEKMAIIPARVAAVSAEARRDAAGIANHP